MYNFHCAYVFCSIQVCGPLKTKLSEYDACYDAESKGEVPCPNISKKGTRILKLCRPTYSWNEKGEPVLNTTYYCRSGEWMLDANTYCQSG